MFYITCTSLLLRFRRRRWHRTNHVIFFIFVAVLSSVQTTFSAPFVRHFESVTESYWSETNVFEICASADRCSLGKFVYLYSTSANFLIDDWTEREILGVLQSGDLSAFTLGLRFYSFPGKRSFNSPWIVIGKVVRGVTTGERSRNWWRKLSARVMWRREFLFHARPCF